MMFKITQDVFVPESNIVGAVVSQDSRSIKIYLHDAIEIEGTWLGELDVRGDDANRLIRVFSNKAAFDAESVTKRPPQFS